MTVRSRVFARDGSAPTTTNSLTHSLSHAHTHSHPINHSNPPTHPPQTHLNKAQTCRLLRKVGQKLAAAAGCEDLPWEFHVIDADEIMNAAVSALTFFFPKKMLFPRPSILFLTLPFLPSPPLHV